MQLMAPAQKNRLIFIGPRRAAASAAQDHGKSWFAFVRQASVLAAIPSQIAAFAGHQHRPLRVDRRLFEQ
jgi:hypothetical protein